MWLMLQLMTDVSFEAANIDTAGKKMYELAGDSSIQAVTYLIAVAESAAGGTIGRFC